MGQGNVDKVRVAGGAMTRRGNNNEQNKNEIQRTNAEY